MSPENQGVFQLMKHEKGNSTDPVDTVKDVDHRIFYAVTSFCYCRVCSKLSKYCLEYLICVYTKNYESLI